MLALSLLLVSLFVLTVASVSAKVTVFEAVETIYDQAREIRINGTGFEADEHNILLDIGPHRKAYLVTGKDFQVKKADDGLGLSLKLLEGRK
jgi:heme exporter protein D